MRRKGGGEGRGGRAAAAAAVEFVDEPTSRPKRDFLAFGALSEEGGRLIPPIDKLSPPADVDEVAGREVSPFGEAEGGGMSEKAASNWSLVNGSMGVSKGR